ncbi:MAG: fasciclin domain-containing protein [Candidatus Woesearchaeota archaeon]|jgi:uncharacterized surface protein with fasciclin (FAS1) repeats|nr:fasciclin domain-containing protein [Candidatus Woesearchaeota archaeon]MDP7622680.1 fasciclin domain-containing protein [Candidatus Woesearchaeota archaeon]HJN57229.1 fasciclin domain-containing protein [Candidatus Woesearchaeota archaeon]|tara:strand:- start:3 stop:437 length:435 start_codon:yes stop_codon:yes gene_type:complete
MKNIYETLKEIKECSVFLSLIEKSSMQGQLSTAKNLTIFVPENKGCACLEDESFLECNLSNVIKYHMINDKLKAINLIPFKLRKTLNGKNVCLEAERVQINASLIIKKDIECSNGYIHIIDAIIVPKDVSCEPNTNYYNYEKDN